MHKSSTVLLISPPIVAITLHFWCGTGGFSIEEHFSAIERTFEACLSLPVLETESMWKLLKPFVLGQEFIIPAVDDNALFNRTIFFRFFCSFFNKVFSFSL
jgi:hypothetical protein